MWFVVCGQLDSASEPLRAPLRPYGNRPQYLRSWTTHSLHTFQEDEDHLTAEELAEWMRESKLVDIILTDYLHLPQYVEKLDKIFR